MKKILLIAMLVPLLGIAQLPQLFLPRKKWR